MTRCAVKGCIQNDGVRGQNRPTFPLPKTKKLQEEWLNLINMKFRNLDCDKSIRVCSRHFPERDMICKTDKDGRIKSRNLKPNGVPHFNSRDVLFHIKKVRSFRNVFISTFKLDLDSKPISDGQLYVF